MLLNSGFQQAPAFQQSQSLPYNTVELLLEDVSKRMASSDLSRRHSRGSTAQRPTAGNMRIVKPNSTSNSPRGSGTLARRKTVMGTGPQRIRPMATELKNNNASVSTMPSLQAPMRPTRPVSWHPSSSATMQPLSQAPPSGMTTNTGYSGYELPMTPAVYSGYTSPASNFSPLSLPYTAYEQYPFPDDTTYFPSLDQNNNVYAPYQPSTLRQQESTPQIYRSTELNEAGAYSHFDWTYFVSNGFNNTTTPPTPETYLPIQHQQTTFGVEEAIPYQPLDDEEEGGEELVALGLYDTPSKPALYDDRLNSYRTTMMQLMGSSYNRQEWADEPSGKGLKLEEAYVPPPPPSNDDEEDDDDEVDDDEDAEGSPVSEIPTSVEDDSVLAKFAGSSSRY